METRPDEVPAKNTALIERLRDANIELTPADRHALLRLIEDDIPQKVIDEFAESVAHQWDETGERCLICGDKDWMGGPCTATPKDARALDMSLEARLADAEADVARLHQEKTDLWKKLHGYDVLQPVTQRVPAEQCGCRISYAVFGKTGELKQATIHYGNNKVAYVDFLTKSKDEPAYPAQAPFIGMDREWTEEEKKGMTDALREYGWQGTVELESSKKPVVQAAFVWKITAPQSGNSWFTEDENEMRRFLNQGHSVVQYLATVKKPPEDQ